MTNRSEIICAVATPPGRGGVGIVRISGTGLNTIADAMIGGLPHPRKAAYRQVLDKDNEVIDEGIAIYFPAPGSFTGEEVLELQGHASHVTNHNLGKAIVGIDLVNGAIQIFQTL